MMLVKTGAEINGIQSKLIKSPWKCDLDTRSNLTRSEERWNFYFGNAGLMPVSISFNQRLSPSTFLAQVKATIGSSVPIVSTSPFDSTASNPVNMPLFKIVSNEDNSRDSILRVTLTEF